MRLRFPRAARLTRAGEFRQVREQGRSWPGRLMVLGVWRVPGVSAADANVNSSRIGLVTSRRVGNAVVRNLVRRRLRDIVRRHRPSLRPGLWLVLVARHPAARVDLATLEAEWLRLGQRASIFLNPPLSPPRAAGDV